MFLGSGHSRCNICSCLLVLKLGLRQSGCISPDSNLSRSELSHGDTCAGVSLMLPAAAQVGPALAESWTCVGPGLTLQLSLFMCWSSCRERCLLPLQMALESKNTKLGQTALTGMQVDRRDDSILWAYELFFHWKNVQY